MPTTAATTGGDHPAAPLRQAVAAESGFAFGAAGDHARGDATVATLKTLSAAGTDFYLALGDFSYGGSESSWCDLVKTNGGPAYPFELISGNHDDEAIDAFTACLPDRIGVTGTYGQEYFFDYPRNAPLARFILISPDLKFGSRVMAYGKGADSYRWLSGAIDDARAKGIPWVVVGMHKVCITAGAKSCEIGADLFNLLVTKKVDLVLAAHDHNYQRSKQLATGAACDAVKPGAYNAACVVDDGANGSYVKGAGPVVVIQGTFGQTMYDIKRKDAEAAYFAAMMGKNVSPTHGFVRYRVTPGMIAAEFVASDEGGFKDAFAIEAGVGKPSSSAGAPDVGPAPVAVGHTRAADPLVAAASGSTGSPGSSTLAIPVPAGAPGDVLLAVIGSDYGHVDRPPPGWTLIRQEVKQKPVDDLAIQSYYKVAGVSDPPAHTWPLVTQGGPAGKGLAAGTIMRFSGISPHHSRVRQCHPRPDTGPDKDRMPERRLARRRGARVRLCRGRSSHHLGTRGPERDREHDGAGRRHVCGCVHRSARGRADRVEAGHVDDVEGGSDDFARAVVLSPDPGGEVVETVHGHLTGSHVAS